MSTRSGARAALAALLLAAICGAAVADDGKDAHQPAHSGRMHAIAPAAVTVGELSLSDAFTRATPPSAKTAGGYLTIGNTGAEVDRLLSAASPAAAKVGLHDMKVEGDQMKMSELEDGIEIPAGQTVTLAPGGLHIMFMGLKAPFIEGQSVPVTLVFEKAGAIELELPVASVAADHTGH
jgi:copper(I)-binding protein